MRHVDEGTIHSWLDEQITDPSEAAWIDEHFRECGECRARLAEERLTFERAQTLLAGAPSGERPSFESLVAKAGRDLQGVEMPSDMRLTRGGRERVLILSGWAASLALAVGLGWTARGLTGGDSPRPDAAPLIAEQSASIPAEPAARAEAPRGLPERLGGIPLPVTKPGSGADASTAPGRQQAAAGSGRVDTTTPSVQPQAPPMAVAGPPQTGTARLEAAPPALERNAAAAAETTSAEAPAVSARPAAVQPVAVQPRAGELRQGALTITGDSAAAVSGDDEWRALPRTEAAVRTGMALYGIDGVEPLVTALSADGGLVRTTYRLASGETVELLQQRLGPVRPPSVADLQTTSRALAQTGRAGIGAAPVPAAARTWSTVRAGVRITLQTTSTATDLDGLGTRLRVD